MTASIMFCVCIDTSVLHTNLNVLLARAATSGSILRVDVSAHLCPGLCARIADHGVVHFAVSTLSGVRIAQIEGADSVLVSRPPTLAEIDALGQNYLLGVVLTIDHFVQAERISKAAVASGAQISVVIDVDTGDGSTGIRPGSDAVDLVLGVRQLPGIYVRGLHTRAAENGKIRRSVRALTHTAGLLHSAGVPCDLTVLNCSQRFQTDEPGDAVNEISFGAILNPRIGAPETVEKKGIPGRPAVWLETEVISRPSLDRAVLNVGDRQLRSQEKIVWLPDFPAAEIRCCGEDHCVVTVSRPAENLRIGDRVRVAVDDSSGSILHTAKTTVIWH